MNNDEIRTYLSKQRQQLSPQYRQKAHRAITKAIAINEHIHKAQIIAGYIAIRSEVNIQPSIDRLVQSNKRVVVPCIDIPHRGDMIFVDYSESLRKVSFGLSEPHSTNNQVDKHAIDAVLVPLLGFTRQCYRIGWGKGYYDKYFADKQQGTRPWLIGIGYACQQDNRITPQPWDVQLDMVITEKEIYLNDETLPRLS